MLGGGVGAFAFELVLDGDERLGLDRELTLVGPFSGGRFVVKGEGVTLGKGLGSRLGLGNAGG